MKIEQNRLLLDQSVEDENVDELIAILLQDNIDTIKLTTKSVSPASMQVLLCHSGSKEITIEDPFLTKLFDALNKKAS